jgi:hypothetical protein
VLFLCFQEENRTSQVRCSLFVVWPLCRIMELLDALRGEAEYPDGLASFEFAGLVRRRLRSRRESCAPELLLVFIFFLRPACNKRVTTVFRAMSLDLSFILELLRILEY